MSTGCDTAEDLIAVMKRSKRNYGFVRMWPGHGGEVNFMGKEPEEFLTAMDRAGVIIRRCGYLDGEAIGYLPGILKPLAPNWYDHLAAWIKGERNHPSVMLWSVENEISFITARNMGQLDVWEPITTKAWEVVQAADPTRPMMVDGGGATRANTLPIHGDHYSTKAFWNYPQLAYEANAKSPCGTWTWDEKRPKFIGEELFAAGINPAYAYFGGEGVFQGKVASRPAVGKAMQVISQGYRWYGITGCDFCQSPMTPTAASTTPGRPRGARPPVGLDVRLRPEGRSHLRHFQQHTLRRSAFLCLFPGAGRKVRCHANDRTQGCRRREREVRPRRSLSRGAERQEGEIHA